MQAELHAQKAVAFWAGKGADGLKRACLRGWALATRLLKSQKSASKQLHTLCVTMTF